MKRILASLAGMVVLVSGATFDNVLSASPLHESGKDAPVFACVYTDTILMCGYTLPVCWTPRPDGKYDVEVQVVSASGVVLCVEYLVLNGPPGAPPSQLQIMRRVDANRDLCPDCV